MIELFAKVSHEWNAGVIVVTHDSRALDVRPDRGNGGRTLEAHAERG
ncbi:MAG: hypothetical protein ACXV8U_12025 [Methylobacter sp.]